MKRMRKCFILMIILGVLLSSTNEYAIAREKDNGKVIKIDLYAIPDRYGKVISIPSKYKQDYKLTYGKGAKYTILYGGSVTVSSDGRIKPSGTIYYLDDKGNYVNDAKHGRKVISYKYGPTFVQVKKGKKIYKIQVNLKNYATTYAEQVLDQYIERYVSSDMTNQDKLKMIAQFPCQYDYGSGVTLEDMVIFGHGDCWASTDAIIRLSNRMGFEARRRVGKYDPGAGEGHENAVVKVDGVDYVLEAGYDQKAPRKYTIWEGTDYGYDIKDDRQSITLRQYDGIERKVNVPEAIDGYRVSEIGKYCFINRIEMKTVNIPECIKKIDDYAFWNSGLRMVKIPEGVEQIGKGAFGFDWDFIAQNGAQVGQIMGLEIIELPASIKSIGTDLSNSVVLYRGTINQWKKVQFDEEKMVPSNKNLFCLTKGLEVSQKRVKLRCGQTKSINIYDLDEDIKVSAKNSKIVSTKLRNEIADEQISQEGIKKQLVHSYKTLKIKAIKKGNEILTISDGTRSLKVYVEVLP